MSNTGYKCISRTQDERYMIDVSWRGELRHTAVRISHYPDANEAMLDALRIRERFERELGKPTTERRILGNTVGVMRTKDGHGNESWMARIAPERGEQLRAHFSIKKHGALVAYEMAKHQRTLWEREYYGI